MRDQLMRILEIIVTLFAVVSMLFVGLAHSLKEIVDPLRKPRLILGALVSNFLLVPLLAILISFFVPLEEPFKIGFLLLATSAGAPFLIKLTLVARRDMAKSAALLIVLLAFTIIYMPIVIPLAIPGVAVSSSTIAFSLFWSMLVPLFIGLLLRERRSSWANRLQPVAKHISNLALVALVLLTVLIHYQTILGTFGSGAIISGLLLTIGAFAVGYLAGGSDSNDRDVLGLATSQRNIAAATVVANQDFDHPKVLVMVIVTSLIALFVLFPIAWGLGRRSIR